MSRVFATALLCLSACSSGTITATLTDGLTGEPVAGVPVTLRARSEVSFSCQLFEGTTGIDGTVTVEGPCLKSSAYSIAPVNTALWFIHGDVVEQNTEGQTAIEVLRAPEGTGSYVLNDGTLTPLSTHGDIKRAIIIGSEEVVEFPSRIPAESDIPLIDEQSWLVLTGPEAGQRARLIPMVKSTPRRLLRNGDAITMQDWWYLGVRFASDSDFTRQAAMVDTSKVRQHAEGDRAAYILPFNAVPSGRYALKTAGNNRVTVLDFGAPPQ